MRSGNWLSPSLRKPAKVGPKPISKVESPGKNKDLLEFSPSKQEDLFSMACNETLTEQRLDSDDDTKEQVKFISKVHLGTCESQLQVVVGLPDPSKTESSDPLIKSKQWFQFRHKLMKWRLKGQSSILSPLISMSVGLEGGQSVSQSVTAPLRSIQESQTLKDIQLSFQEMKLG